MNLLNLSLAITLMFIQTAYTRFQRRPARAPFMTALQNNMGPGYERLLISNRRPIAEVMLGNQIGLPNTLMAMDGMPNTRIVKPKCQCQMETPCQKIQEMPAMTGSSSYKFPASNMPFVPSAPVASVPLAPMPIFPPVPEVAAVSSAPTLVPDTCSCREPTLTALVSPFLPAASPISALAPPTSNLLPPVLSSQNRNHFLRKIPIPPPTL